MIGNDNLRPSLSSTIINVIRISKHQKSMTNVGHRLEQRKHLQHRLCLVSNIMCFLGVFGIVLMIINNEVTFATGDDVDTAVNWFLKLTITVSTIILIGLIIYYHKLDLNFYSVKNSVDDWRIGLTGKKICLIIIEILICCVHPIPRYFHPDWTLNPTTGSIPFSYISFDVALGLPMFARLYLVCRFMTFHSSLVHKPSLQSLGYFNQVSTDFFFLIKTYLEQWPARCLAIFCIIIFLIGSWSLHACNYYPTGEHESMLDSMWLFVITFTTVGYGDIVPTTYCGRTVASLVGLTGILSSALFISVLAQKLVLTRWEKCVYNFVSNIELAKERKDQAANVIKFAIKIWYLRRKDKSKSIQCFKAQWKLFRSIRIVQEVKLEQRKLIDGSIVLADLFTLQRNENDQTEKIAEQMDTMKTTIDKIEEKFIDMNQMMNNMQYKLNLFLDRVHIQEEIMI